MAASIPGIIAWPVVGFVAAVFAGRCARMNCGPVASDWRESWCVAR